MVIEVYRDDGGAWRWRLRVDHHGATLAESAGGYADEAQARRAAHGFQLAAANAPIIGTTPAFGHAA